MIYYLENIYVSRNGSLLNNDFKFLEKESIIFFLWERAYQKYNIDQIELYTIDKVQKGNYIKLDDNQYIFAYPYHDYYPFGHLWDSFRQLKEIEDNNIQGTLLLSNMTFGVNDLFHHIELFGFDKSKTILCNCKDYVYLVPNLIVVVDDVYLAQLNKEQVNWLRNKYMYNNKFLDVSKINNSNLNLKLYLDRDNDTKRKVINNNDVKKLLIDNNYIILNGRETLEEHIFYFSNAVKIIGPHGSLFRNGIFSLKNPEFYEFCPDNRKDSSIKQMNETCGNTKYNQYFINGDNDCNIFIDIDKLKEIL